MTNSTRPIPTFYRIFFIWIDPLIALHGAYADFFDQNLVLGSLFPSAQTSATHSMIFHQLGGAFIQMAFLMVTLLRYTEDVMIWKLFEFAILITDFTMMYSFYVGLQVQGRLPFADWRWEEWLTMAIVWFVTLVRIFFIAGIGFSKKKVASGKVN